MQSIIKHAAPNVVPGTNFNTARFRELYAWMSSMAADVARSSLAAHQYGLLIPFDGKAALQLEKTAGLLTLRRCAGISPGGRIIGIFEEATPILEMQLEHSKLDAKEKYHVMIEVEGSERTAFGQGTDDLPQRPQFSMPTYSLHLQSVSQALGRWADAFPVGTLQHTAGEWVLTNYIPPCAHIGAHELLRTKYRDYQEALKTMLTAQPIIIRQTDSFRDKAMIELREFTMQCGSFLASRKTTMAMLTETGQPTRLLEIWVAYAELIAFLLNCLTDRPGFYNLLYQNTKSVNGVMFTTNRLDQVLFELINHEYSHQDIMKTINAIDEFLLLVVPMFKALGIGTLQAPGLAHEGTYKAPDATPKRAFPTW